MEVIDKFFEKAEKAYGLFTAWLITTWAYKGGKVACQIFYHWCEQFILKPLCFFWAWLKRAWKCVVKNLNLFEVWLKQTRIYRAIARFVARFIAVCERFGAWADGLWDRKTPRRIIKFSALVGFLAIISVWVMAIKGILSFGEDLSSLWDYFLAGFFINNNILSWVYDEYLKFFQGNSNALTYCSGLLIVVIAVAWVLKRCRPQK